MTAEESAFRFFVSYAVASDRYEQTRDIISQIVPEPDTVVTPDEVREITENIEVTQELFAAVYNDYSALVEEDVSEGIMQQVSRSYGWVRRWDEQTSMWMAGLEHKIWKQRNGYLDQLREETESAARRFGLRSRPEDPDVSEEPEDDIDVDDLIVPEDDEIPDDADVGDDVVDGWEPAPSEDVPGFVGEEDAEPVDDDEVSEPAEPSEDVPEKEDGSDDADLFVVDDRVPTFYGDIGSDRLYTEAELQLAMKRGMDLGIEMGREQAMAEARSSASAGDSAVPSGVADSPEPASAEASEPQTAGTEIRRTSKTETKAAAKDAKVAAKAAGKTRKPKRTIRRRKGEESE